MTSIGSQAFNGCSALTFVTIGNGVTSIGSQAFNGCSGLSYIIVRSGNTVYDSRDNCNAIIEKATNTLIAGCQNTVIPNSVTSIGNYAFYGCSGLTSIDIPSSVTSIGDYAFQNCAGLTSITIPNSVTSIGNRAAFSGCSSLSSVAIPDGVTTINQNTFLNCSSLTSITIGNGVRSIHQRAFSGCFALTSVNIPNNVTKIYDFAFLNCSGLTSVIIGNGVTSIGNNAFYGCSGLASITIGSGVEWLGSEAFAKCSELTDTYCHAEIVPNTTLNAFNESLIENATLHVPATSVNLYKAAEPWKNFKSIVAINDETPGDTPEIKKCEKPTISYQNGKLTFTCATEGATCHYSITDTDIKTGNGNEVQLTATYNISVYATKEVYENSETAKATLCWIEATLEPEGTTTRLAQISARPVLVKANNGFVTVEGVDAGTNIVVYTVDGKRVASTVSQNNTATIATSLKPSSIAILKIGEKTVKIKM